MRIGRTILGALLLALSLGGCSYSYDLIAVARNGEVVFDIAPTSPEHPTCVRQVEVYAEDEREATWRESVSHENGCANKFPLRYGVALLGAPHSEVPEVAAKRLRREVVYEVTTTTGATGYGFVRFLIHANGTIENLPRSSASQDIDNKR